MQDTIKATSIGLGIETNRKLEGLMWFYAKRRSSGGLLTGHTNAACLRIRNLAEAERLPVFREEDVLYVEWNTPRGGLEKPRVTPCSHCPAEFPDTDWKRQAVCLNKDGAFDPGTVDDFIQEYCSVCPVQLECLEYGAAFHEANSGAVWGGVHFSTKIERRLPAIEKRRKELWR